MIEDIIGFAAGFLIAVSMIPQLIKSHRTSELSDYRDGRVRVSCESSPDFYENKVWATKAPAGSKNFISLRQ